MFHIYAVRTGNIEVLKRSIEAFPDFDINFKNKKKRTALHIAAEKGCGDMVRLLLEKKAFVNAEDENDRTPLFLAVFECKVDVVKILIENGANIYHRADGPYIEREWLPDQGNNLIIQQTVFFHLLDSCAQEYGYDYDIIDLNDELKQKRKDCIEIADMLINYGANMDCYFADDDNYLHGIHNAIRAGFPTIVGKMLKFRPSLVNKKEKLNEQIKFPLDIALENYDQEIIMILIQNGANIYANVFHTNIMEILQKLNNKEILEEAIVKGNKIKDFIKICDHIYRKRKAPENWNKNDFMVLYNILGDSIDYINDVNVSLHRNVEYYSIVKRFLATLKKQKENLYAMIN